VRSLYVRLGSCVRRCNPSAGSLSPGRRQCRRPSIRLRCRARSAGAFCLRGPGSVHPWGRRLLPLRRGHGFRNLATEPERFGEHRASFGISGCRQRMIAPQRPPLAVFISAQTVLCIVRIRFPPPERVSISWDFAFPRQKVAVRVGVRVRQAARSGRDGHEAVISADTGEYLSVPQRR